MQLRELGLIAEQLGCSLAQLAIGQPLSYSLPPALNGCSVVQKIVIESLIEIVIEIASEIRTRGSTVQKIVIEN